MSDYLASLAAKALGRTEPVRPRLASRFEPVGALPMLPAEPVGVEPVSLERPFDPVGTIRVSAQPVAMGPDRPPAMMAAIGPAATPGSPRPDDESRAIAAGHRPSRPLEADMVAEPKAAAHRAASLSPVTQDHPLPTGGGRRPETPVRVEVAGFEREKAPTPDIDAPRDGVPAQVEARMGGLEDRIASLEASALGFPTTRRQAAPLVPAVVTRSLPLPSVPSAPRTPAPIAADAVEHRDRPSQVSVTIGRVEVRATFPVPVQAQRKPAAGSTPTTLAEYLKQRERGRR